MPPPRTGSVEPFKRADGSTYYRARIRLADDTRTRVDVPEKHCKPAGGLSGRERAEQWAAAMQEDENETGELLRKKQAGALGRRPKVKATADMATWLDTWIKHRTLNGQTSTRENRSHYETHIAPAIGAKHVRDWTADDLRKLSRYLDAQIADGKNAWKTARNVWTTAGEMLADSVRSKRDDIRCRLDNPIRDVEGPNRGADRAHPYLYPSELLAFVGCEDVPLMWRRAVALGVYTYTRAAELRALRWEDIDLEHGTLHVHRARERDTGEDKSTKTKQTRRFTLEPAIVPLLRTMQAEAEEEGHGGPADHVVELTSARDLARGLKRWLRKAGIKRPELYVTDTTRQAIRFHDLRATGITWMAVRKDAPPIIQSRAGHTDYTTTLGYIREAETLAHGFGEVFPALPPSRPIGPRIGPSRGKRYLSLRNYCGVDGTRTRENAADSVGSIEEPPTSAAVGAHSRPFVPSGAGEVSDAEMVAAVARAMLAGRGELAEFLMHEVRRRRQALDVAQRQGVHAAPPSNVVPLSTKPRA